MKITNFYILVYLSPEAEAYRKIFCLTGEYSLSDHFPRLGLHIEVSKI